MFCFSCFPAILVTNLVAPWKRQTLEETVWKLIKQPCLYIYLKTIESLSVGWKCVFLFEKVIATGWNSSNPLTHKKTQHHFILSRIKVSQREFNQIETVFLTGQYFSDTKSKTTGCEFKRISFPPFVTMGQIKKHRLIKEVI